ncbi:calpastatin isoform X5 [Mustelus asterias]
MSQPNKRKGKEPRKGSKKSDSTKSSKQGASVSAQAPEEKPKVSQVAKAEGSKPMSSTSKDKATSGHSAKSSGAPGGKQQQAQTAASQQAEMGLGWFKSAEVDAKEKPLARSASVPATSVHKTTNPKLQASLKASTAAPVSAGKGGAKAPLKASTAAPVSAGKSDAKDEDPFDLLAGTFPSEAPDNSAPKYTGPEVKELDATKKKAEKVGEKEESIPPDYRFKEKPDPKDKGKVASPSTGPGEKPKATEKSMTEGDILDSLSADFVQSSAAPISKCSAPTSHAAAPPSIQKEAPLKASTAAPVSADKSDAKGEDPFDLLAGTLPSEAPDNSGPKYTGPPVKESDATKKKAEKVGEKEESIPPDYRFKEQPDPKDKGKVASSSTGPGAKPKVTEKSMTEGDILDSLSTDFAQSSPAPVSKCSAPTSHAAAPPTVQKEAPLKASTAAPVSAGKSGAKGEDPFDLLAGTLPSEAPDNSGPKYTGPPVKEPNAAKKKPELVGETEESIPPDYRFKEQPDPKDKGKVPSSSTGPGAKPKAPEKSMTEGDILDSLSADFVQSSPAPVSKRSAPTSHSAAPPSIQKEAPLKAATAASVSASKSSAKGEDPFDLLAGTLPSEAPDDSGPKYTGPPVKESDATKKKAERVGEKEESIPPDYRFKEQPDPKDKRKVLSSSTGPDMKPKVTGKSMAEGDVLDSLSADFVQSSPAPVSKCSAPVSKCSAPTSHAAAPPSVPKEAPLKASTAAPVSAGKSDAKDEDPFDLLAGTFPSEAPDNSAPKYTGPLVKESDATKKKAERVGETEGSIPPDYRFKEQPDPKKKDKEASPSSGPGARPKETEKSMMEGDILDSLSADFVQSSPAPVSKCSAPISKCSAPTSHAAAPPSLQKEAPLKASTAASVSASKSGAKGEDPFDLLAGTLPSEAPDDSGPKYTGPPVKESDATKKKAERVGEKEESIPPDYRFKEQPDPKGKDKATSSSTGPGTKPKATEKSMTEGDILDSLSADFIQSSPAPVSKCSAPTSRAAAPPTVQKEAPLKASTAASVSASQSGIEDEDPFDLLADSLSTEAPDNSAPKYTGPEVKESDVTKTKVERMGEKEESIPPDYRFKEQPDPKDKSKVVSSSTGPGAKPKVTEKSLTEGDVLDSLSADFVHSSSAPISKCSAPTSHSAAPPSMQKEAPLKSSTAASVSASKSGAKGEDPFDLLAGTLPSEAPDNSGPKYTGPPVKESDATKKKAELVGETEESIPPDYRFKEQPDPKDKGKVASSSTGPGTKPKATEKSMTEGDILDSLSADFVQTSPAPISKYSAPTSHAAAPPSVPKQAPLKALTAASVSAGQSDAKVDHGTGNGSKTASTPNTSDVEPKSPKAKDQPTATLDAKKARKR